MKIRVKEWREKRGLSLRGLAGRAKVNFVTLHRIETDQMSPTVALLEKLARGLGITVRDFFPVETKPRRTRRRT